MKFEGSTINPGIMVGLSESFLNDIFNDQVPNIQTALQNITFEDGFEYHKLFVGIKLTNITIDKFSLQQSSLFQNFKLNDKKNTISFKLLIKEMKISFNYNS